MLQRISSIANIYDTSAVCKPRGRSKSTQVTDKELSCVGIGNMIWGFNMHRVHWLF